MARCCCCCNAACTSYALRATSPYKLTHVGRNQLIIRFGHQLQVSVAILVATFSGDFSSSSKTCFELPWPGLRHPTKWAAPSTLATSVRPFVRQTSSAITGQPDSQPGVAAAPVESSFFASFRRRRRHAVSCVGLSSATTHKPCHA